MVTVTETGKYTALPVQVEKAVEHMEEVPAYVYAIFKGFTEAVGNFPEILQDEQMSDAFSNMHKSLADATNAIAQATGGVPAMVRKTNRAVQSHAQGVTEAVFDASAQSGQ
jgi:hypothetical protein